QQRRLHAVLAFEFGQDAADVGLRGGLAHVRAARDLAVRQPFGQQVQHLAFAGRQAREPGTGLAAPRCGLGGDEAEDEPGHGRRQVGLALVDGADGADELFGRAGLQQEPGRAALDGREHVVLVAEGGQDQGADGAEALEDVEAAEAGHVEVEQRHVDAVGGRERLAAVVGGRGHGDVAGRFEDGADALDDERLVVGDEDPDHGWPPVTTLSGRNASSTTAVPITAARRLRRGSATGSMALRWNRPSAVRRSRRPPADATRSLSPVRPKPPEEAGAGPAATGLDTETISVSSSQVIATRTGRPGACLAALASPSSTTP